MVAKLRSSRLTALDAARAISALFVACFHIDGNVWPTRGYLAVDLFFLLSGYVIAATYEDRLRNGGSASWFFGLRMARLYPLYLVGTLLGLAVYLATHPPTGAAQAFVSALAFVPAQLPLCKEVYPLNGAMWSLAAEVFVNILYAWIGFRLSQRALTYVVIGAAAVMLMLVLINGGANLGNDYRGLPFLAIGARVLFGFPLGVLIYRLHRSHDLPAVTFSHGFFLAFVAAAYCAVTVSAARANATIDSILLFVALPICLVGLVGARAPGQRLAQAYGWIGGVSYALYAVHLPIGLFVRALLVRAGAFTPGVELAIALPVSVLAAVFAAQVIEPRGRRLMTGLVRLCATEHGAKHQATAPPG